MRLALLLALLLPSLAHAQLRPAAIPIHSPADAWLAAAADIQDPDQVPAVHRPTTRYLALWHVRDPLYRREVCYRVISEWLNGFSTNGLIILPRPVPGTDYALFRVNLRDYGIPAEVWDRLAFAEPYSYRVIEVPWGYWSGNQWVTTRTVKTTAVAPWVQPTDRHVAAASTLLLLTGGAGRFPAPVVNGQWWFAQTAIQEGRDDTRTGYYDFLGVDKDANSWLDLSGGREAFDRSKTLQLEVGALVARSREVALNNRRLKVREMLTGKLFYSEDFASSVGKANVIRNPDGTEPDASEQIAPRSNGLPAFWLQDGKGKRQNSPPDFIASNRHAPGTDGRVHVGVTCIRCHERVLHDIDDYARRVWRKPLGVQSPVIERFDGLVQLYFRSMNERLDDARTNYAKAVRKATALPEPGSVGLELKEWSGRVGNCWDDWQEKDWTLDRIAALTGHTPPAIVTALSARARVDKQLDLVLLGLLADPPEPLRIENLEEIYPLLQEIMAGETARRRGQ